LKGEPSKIEFERVFNELFGTHINWRKLTKTELVELATVLNHPEILLAKLGIKKEQFKALEVRNKLVDASKEVFTTFFENWEGPLVKIARKVLDFDKKKYVDEEEMKDISAVKI